MFSSDMVPVSERPSDHRGIYARILNKANAGSYAPYRHCTSQPEASILTTPDWQVPYHYADHSILGNTIKILPTAACYLSHVLQVLHNMDRWYLPSLSWQQAVILRYR